MGEALPEKPFTSSPGIWDDLSDIDDRDKSDPIIKRMVKEDGHELPPTPCGPYG